MVEKLVTRRLAAIVIADVVGYTRLMERDDTGTFARLRSIRDEVVDPAIVSHDGRIVKTAGDGLLAEFPSALAALRASVQIQQEMVKRNNGVAPEDGIDYRIGVNLGDIMVDGADIAGDGVNVASRLESLAEPGGICVSAAVREQVHGQLAVEFVDIGEQQVKNIERPIRVYRVDVATVAATATRRVRETQRRTRIGWKSAGALGAVLALVGLGMWTFTRMGTRDPAAPLPFSLAVLPFTAAAEDAETADRMTRDLTQYAPAVPACERAAALDPRSWQNQLQLVAAYAQNGDMAKAAIAKAELLKLQPGHTIAKDRARLFSDHPEFVKQIETHLYPGLRKAGIPEQ